MSSKHDFRHTRWQNTLHSILQAMLAITLVVALNYIATYHYDRIDITQNKRYSLSPETIAYIQRLERPVEVIVTIPDDPSTDDDVQQYFEDVSRLLEQYEFASRKGKESTIKVEYVNIYSQRKKAQQIEQQYGLTRPNAILFVSGDNQREIDPVDLYDTEDGELKAFRGEQIFTSAILDISNPTKQKIYFLVGHGEMRLDETDRVRGLSVLASFLMQRNLAVAPLDLTVTKNIPEDTSLIIVPAPRTPLLPQEVELLRNYMNKRNGRITVLLDAQHEHGMNQLFYDWGLRADDMVIIDAGKDYQSDGGDLVIRKFADHPITDFLVENQIPVSAGLCQSVRPDPGAPLDETLDFTYLMSSSPTSWAESAWRTGTGLKYNPEIDLEGPVGIGMLAERKVGTQLGMNISGGKFALFGNADFIANERLGTLGNLVLFYNTINWLLDRNNQLNIPPKPIDKVQLALSQDDLSELATGLAVPPLAFAILGILVWFIRRRQ